MKVEHRIGFEPMFPAWQASVFDRARLTMRMVGVDRIELSPRVPKTRMLVVTPHPAMPPLRVELRLE